MKHMKIEPGRLHFTSMSKRQRSVYIAQELNIPTYMQKRFAKPESENEKVFTAFHIEMIRGTTPMDIPLLRKILEACDKERYATPK